MNRGALTSVSENVVTITAQHFGIPGELATKHELGEGFLMQFDREYRIRGAKVKKGFEPSLIQD